MFGVISEYYVGCDFFHYPPPTLFRVDNELWMFVMYCDVKIIVWCCWMMNYYVLWCQKHCLVLLDNELLCTMMFSFAPPCLALLNYYVLRHACCCSPRLGPGPGPHALFSVGLRQQLLNFPYRSSVSSSVTRSRQLRWLSPYRQPAVAKCLSPVSCDLK